MSRPADEIRSAGYGGYGRCLSCDEVFPLDDASEVETCPKAGCGVSAPTDELRHYQNINSALEEAPA